MWSLGCTIIEMITGEPPWVDNKDYLSTLYKILHSNKPPEFPKNISDKLYSFLSYCFKMNPYERLNVTKLLKHPFIIGTNVELYENEMKLSKINLPKVETKLESKIEKVEQAMQSSSVLNLGGSLDEFNSRREFQDSLFHNQTSDLIKDKFDKFERTERKKSISSCILNLCIILNRFKN